MNNYIKRQQLRRIKTLAQNAIGNFAVILREQDSADSKYNNNNIAKLKSDYNYSLKQIEKAVKLLRQEATIQ